MTFRAAVHESPLSQAIGPNLLHSEGETQARQRPHRTVALRPAAVLSHMQQVIDDVTEHRLAALIPDTDADLIGSFAEPLAIRVLRRVTGLPELDDAVLRSWLVGIDAGASNYEKDPGKTAAAGANREIDQVVERQLATGPRPARCCT